MADVQEHANMVEQCVNILKGNKRRNKIHVHLDVNFHFKIFNIQEININFLQLEINDNFNKI
jgi:hypothetical protein